MFITNYAIISSFGHSFYNVLAQLWNLVYVPLCQVFNVIDELVEFLV